MSIMGMDIIPDQHSEGPELSAKFERIAEKLRQKIDQSGGQNFLVNPNPREVALMAKKLSHEHGSAIHAIKIFDPKTHHLRNVMWLDESLQRSDIQRMAHDEGLEISHYRSFVSDVSDPKSERRFRDKRWGDILAWPQSPPGEVTFAEELDAFKRELRRVLSHFQEWRRRP